MSQVTERGIADPFRQQLEDAVSAHRAGQLQAAERLYRTILRDNPSHADANHNLGMLAAQVNQPLAALPLLRNALAANPQQQQYWFSCIEVLIQARQWDEAKRTLDEARTNGLDQTRLSSLAAKLSAAANQTAPQSADIQHLVHLFSQGRYADMESAAVLMTQRFPQNPEGWKALGTAMAQQGRTSQAIEILRKCADLAPLDIEIRSNLAHSYYETKQFAQAEAEYRHALSIQPHDAVIHDNLGTTLHAQERYEESEACHRRAFALAPDFAHACSNVGVSLYAQGRFDEAGDAFRQALGINPHLPEALSNLASLLYEKRKYAEAEAHIRHTLTLVPNSPRYLTILALILNATHRYAEAEAACRTILNILPDDREAIEHLGVALIWQRRYAEAETIWRQILDLDPDNAEMHTNLGTCLMSQSRYDEAQVSFRKALSLKPDLTLTHTCLLFCLSHTPNITPTELRAAHFEFGQRYETSLKADWAVHTNDRVPDKVLRVGFVSADFCDHAVANFIEPILEHLSQFKTLQLHAYSHDIRNDDVTQRLRALFSHWREIVALTDDEMARTVREDGIDILVDLSGHTAFNRLMVFARKPAPLQVSWIGYPGTTGLDAMDYYFSDRYFLPPGKLDDQFSEKIARLPGNATFRPSPYAPEPGSLPALHNGYVTFGSFNRMSKINEDVIGVWARLMHALPRSRMLVGGLDADQEFNIIAHWFAAHGIEKERLAFRRRTSMADYLSMHHHVDICLDTFPYAGGTTTLHAAWMGVPTLTMDGATMPARTGACLLGHLGLSSFLAKDTDDFVERGRQRAMELDELVAIRADLRQRLSASALGHPENVAKGAERAFRFMWHRWCNGQPPESFDVTELPVDQ